MRLDRGPGACRRTGVAHPHRHAVIRAAEPLPGIIPPERPVVIAERRVAAADLAGVFADPGVTPRFAARAQPRTPA